MTMTLKINYKPKSFKNEAGKWIPSGAVIYRDAVSVSEVLKTYTTARKETKKEADNFFIVKSKKELSK